MNITIAKSIPNKFRSTLAARPLKIFATNKNVIKIRAEKTDTSLDINQTIKNIADKWEKVENKTSVIIYGGGAAVILWLSSTIIGAVNNIPLFPKLLELIGLAYTVWFVYRYLLFKEARKELIHDIEATMKKVSIDQ